MVERTEGRGAERRADGQVRHRAMSFSWSSEPAFFITATPPFTVRVADGREPTADSLVLA